jgi:hypothetical protein
LDGKNARPRTDGGNNVKDVVGVKATDKAADKATDKATDKMK